MKCSNGIGRITSSRELYSTTEEGEKFYKIIIRMDGYSFVGIISEFILGDIEQQKVEFRYYIRTETTADNKMFTYLNILNMTVVEESVPESREVQIEGVITKVNPLTVKEDKGQQILPFMVRYSSYDNNTNKVHCVLKDFLARKHSKMQSRDTVDLKGNLRSFGAGAIEVDVTEVKIHRKREV